VSTRRRMYGYPGGQMGGRRRGDPAILPPLPSTVVSAPSTLAAEAGARVADLGGNAVDAAIAATIAGMVTEPGIVAPGGGCFIAISPPEGAAIVIDGYAAKPGLGAAVDADGEFGSSIYMGYGGGTTTLIGPRSVAVPGAWDALGMASDHIGAVPWHDLVRPAIDSVSNGFPLSAASALYLGYSYEPIFSLHDENRAMLSAEDGTLAPAGAMVVPRTLAAGLTLIAEEGPRTWYEGSVAEALLGMMAEEGGLISDTDLAAFRAEIRTPIAVDVGAWDVATNPPPSLGGPVLAAMLLLLADAGFSGWGPDGIAAMLEVQRLVLTHRRDHLDEAADRAAAALRLLEAAAMGDRAALESPSTIHVSAVDAGGLACSITTSAGYGSGLVIPGTGLALNNSLGEVDLHPSGLGSVRPGERLPSNMAPTVARGADGAVISLGTPGAGRITTALAHVVAGVALAGDDLGAAIDRPRLHVETAIEPVAVSHEEPLEAPESALETRRFPKHSMYFGGVAAAERTADGALRAFADPRRSGGVATGGV
jgi:gamma-glutamyltranspeptidase / glutathione hydrolase